MARYIDADAFLKAETKRCGCVPLIGTCTTDNESLAYRLAKTPTANVVEVKRGEWQATEAYPRWFCCSVCHRRFVPNDEWIDRYNIPINYCPNCCAKMDGGKAE